MLGPKQRFEVEGLTHDAKGVARLNGKVTFIAGALPGETVEAQIVKTSKSYDEAQLSKIVIASEYRIKPACQHFNECGGCSFQHLEQPKQLEAKQQWMVGELRKVIGDLPISLLSDKDFEYRRRARIAIKVKEGKVQIGFRGKASKNIISIDQCIVLTVPLQSLFTSLKTAFLTDKLVHHIGHLELLEDDKGVSLTIRLIKAISPATSETWSRWAIQHNVDLYWQHPDSDIAEVNDNDQRFYKIEDLTLRYHPQDFIQVNSALNKKMVAQALEWLAPSKNDVVLDLFCGVGNFSLPLATHAGQVVGVEVQESMVAAGIANARLNKLTNLNFLAADLTKTVSAKLIPSGVTKVLLDPPRSGAFEFLDTLIKIKPKQILYVSCNASTLARDAEYLVANKYKVIKVCMMDMFPQTSHVESMMLFERN
jgi:23S rRNA (uracil1939-C5)-methyltransferase